MGLITTEPRSSPHPLSPRLVHELGDPHSTLRATTDGSGAALLIHAGGEIDGRNEHLWRQLVTEAAAGVTRPDRSSSTSPGSISWAAALSPHWPTRHNDVGAAASTCVW